MQKAVIEIITHKDDPSGLKTVAVAGKSIKAFVIPRVDIADIGEFENIDMPGVYFLLNEDEEEKSVYIGQSNNVLRRLEQQKLEKENWTISIAFTAGKEINAPFLEKLCIKEVITTGRYKTSNKTGSPGNSISKSAEIVNHQFMDEIKFVTKLLGFRIFSSAPASAPENKYSLKSKDIKAVGMIMEGNEFLVYQDSESSLNTSSGLEIHVKSSVRLRNKLIEEKVIQLADKKDRYIFTKDYIFNSPSAAAEVVNGMSTNGWTAWKDQNGKTLDENIRKTSLV